MTLTEFVLGTQGLIAHYPIYGNGDDVSGNDYHLSNVNAEYPVDFLGAPLNADLMPSYAISVTKTEDGKYNGSYLSVPQPLGIKCVSLYVEMPEDTDTLGAFFTLNGLYDAVLSNDRINIAWRYSELRVGSGVAGSDSVTGVYVSSLKGKKIHVLVQETSNGQGYEIIIDGVMFYSESNRNIFNMLINSPNRIFALGTHTYLQQGSHIQVWCAGASLYSRRLTNEEIETLVSFKVSVPIVTLQSFIQATWSNRETIEQANPQPEQLAYHAESLQKVNTVVKNNPFYNDVVLDQNGEQRKFGSIESTTEISGEPVANKRVLCFAQDTGLLIDETISDATGAYRFDSLLLSKKFMITAQFGNDDSTSPPEYQAVSSDWQTPTPYGTENEEEQ